MKYSLSMIVDIKHAYDGVFVGVDLGSTASVVSGADPSSFVTFTSTPTVEPVRA